MTDCGTNSPLSSANPAATIGNVEQGREGNFHTSRIAEAPVATLDALSEFRSGLVGLSRCPDAPETP